MTLMAKDPRLDATPTALPETRLLEPGASPSRHLVEWKLGVAIMTGLLTGAAVARDAIHSLRSASLPGTDIFAVPVMWVAGTLTTATGVGLFVYFGLGVVQLWSRERRTRRENGPPP